MISARIGEYDNLNLVCFSLAERTPHSSCPHVNGREFTTRCLCYMIVDVFRIYVVFQMSLKQEIRGGEKFELRLGHMLKRLAATLLLDIQSQPQFGKILVYYH